jgi:DNA invertase Pin-like site-specific DNA recombinase
MDYVIYYRVSTHKQGIDGHGMAAQRRDIRVFLDNYTSEGDQVLRAYREVQSGADAGRPQLARAMAFAKRHKATLLVSKLDRLSRDVEAIAGYIKRVPFKVACMPQADVMQLQIYAVLAEQERRFISQRTKAAMAEAKLRGRRFGGDRPGLAEARARKAEEADNRAERLRTLLTPQVRAGNTLQAMADALNDVGIQTARGCTWDATRVRRVLQRLKVA